MSETLTTSEPAAPTDVPVASERRVHRLKTAAHRFRLGRYAEVLAFLEKEPDLGGEVGRAIHLVARGAMLDEKGRATEAAPLMEEALGLIVPTPAVLEVIADFFGRHGDPLLAHYAFLLAEVYRPMSMSAFEERIDEAERTRYVPWVLRGSPLAARSDLYGLAVRKRELRERIGPEGLALVMATMAGERGSHDPVRLPLRRLADHILEHGRDAHEMSMPRPVRYEPPRTIGIDDLEASERETGPFVRGILDDAIVSALSDVVLVDGVATIDVTDTTASRILFDADPILAGREGGDAFVLEPRPGSIRSIPAALWLSGRDSRSFGDWIVGFLPKILACLDDPGFADLPIIIDDGMYPQQEEALRLFAPHNPIVRLERDEQVQVGALTVVTSVFRGETVDIDMLRALLDRARPILERFDAPTTPERVFLTRKPVQHRRLVNIEEIEALAAERGYALVDPAELPFDEQLRLVRGARHIIGPAGSAFLLTFFGRSGLRIGVFNHPITEEVAGYAHVTEALGQDLTVIGGEIQSLHPRFEHMSDYRLDPDVVAGYLDRVAPELAGSAADS